MKIVRVAENSLTSYSKSKGRMFYVIGFIVLIVLLAASFLPFRVSDITLWAITGTNNVHAEILWQKHDPCLTTGYTTLHGAITASNSQLVFHRSCYGIDGSYVAVDLLTGEEIWRSAANGDFQVISIDGGFLGVFEDSFIRKINHSGQTVWESQRFASRSMRAVFPQGDLIYAPFRTTSDTGIHVISQQTGEIVQTIEDQNIIAVFDDFIVRGTDSGTIEVVDAENGNAIWSIRVPIASYIPSFSDVGRVGNVLLFYFGRNRTDAFDISSGERLWSIEQTSGSYPLLLQNTLLIYGLDNKLSAYDPENGQNIGQVILSRSGRLDSNSGRPESNVALAGYNDIVSLMFRNTLELVTLRVDILNG